MLTVYEKVFKTLLPTLVVRRIRIPNFYIPLFAISCHCHIVPRRPPFTRLPLSALSVYIIHLIIIITVLSCWFCGSFVRSRFSFLAAKEKYSVCVARSVVFFSSQIVYRKAKLKRVLYVWKCFRNLFAKKRDLFFAAHLSSIAALCENNLYQYLPRRASAFIVLIWFFDSSRLLIINW